MWKVLAAFIVVMLFVDPAQAARRKSVNHNFDFTTSERYAGLVVNSETGEVLYQRNAGRLLHPASLTKMMTLYLAFNAVDSGELSMEQRLTVSLRAASQPKTNLRLKPGMRITVREAILGLIVHSANDAAVVLAEAISGNEDAFANQMTVVAKSLGMKDTEFHNAHGLPHSEQVTTAYDMARLAIALRRDFPNFYPLFSVKSFKFNGNIVNTHNRIMHRYAWADGLKTGFINSSGFNLVTSTKRHDGRLVGVVMGGHTAYARDTHMIHLLEYGYERMQEVALARSRSLDRQKEAITVADNQNIQSVPYKEGVFEVAQATSGTADIDEDEQSDDVESGTDVSLGSIVSNDFSLKPKPNSGKTKKVIGKKSKPKVTIVKGKKQVRKALKSVRNKNLIIVKNSKPKVAKARTRTQRSKAKAHNSQVG